MKFFDESSILEKLPFIVIIIFLIIVLLLLMADRKNLTKISERQNNIKDKIDDINIPSCPTCPANPRCPICPKQPRCPDITCPKCEDKECPVCEETNSNVPSLDTECPACPACPNQDLVMPTAEAIADAIFPGRNDGILFSGKHYPVKEEEYIIKKSPVYANLNQGMTMGNNSNIVPVTDVFMGGYAPFKNKDTLMPEENMYPINLNPNTNKPNTNRPNMNTNVIVNTNK